MRTNAVTQRTLQLLDTCSNILLCFLTFLALLWPAIFNGFPFICNNSGTYLSAAITHHLPVDRPIYYSIFIYLFHWRRSLWPIILAQSAIASAVFVIFLKKHLPAISRRGILLLALTLSLLTNYSFFISQVMPDFLTALMVLNLCTLVFVGDTLSSIERWFLYFGVLLAICSHQANFIIASIVLLAAFACSPFISRPRSVIRTFQFPCLLVLTGFVLLVLPVMLRHQQFVPTEGSNVFLLAKLIDDGPALDYLKSVCPVRHYSICGQINTMEQYKRNATAEQSRDVPLSDFILWHGPFDRAGGWMDVTTYAAEVDRSAVLTEPMKFAAASLEDSADQLVRLGTGDDLQSLSRTNDASVSIQRFFPPGVFNAYSRSRQQVGKLHLARLSRLYSLVVAVSFCIVAFFVAVSLSRSQKNSLLPTVITLITAFIANAVVLGSLSAVHDRYQSRVGCLIAMAALILTADRGLTTPFRDVRRWLSGDHRSVDTVP